MKAAICTSYGAPEVLQIKEVSKPKPKNNEVSIKIHASAVTASDIFIRGLDMPWKFRILIRLTMGWIKPRMGIIGIVLSGEVESIGKKVTKFKPGDQVYGLTGYRLACYAEYTCVKEKDSIIGAINHKPKNLTHEESTAAAYGGLLALQYLEKGNVKSGDKVLIYGASGTSGTIAVQIAKQMGAHVTGVCSTKNLGLVKSLGADAVIDYTTQNKIPNGTKYNFVLDAVGKAKTSILKIACKNALLAGGKYVSIDNGDLKLDADRLSRLKNLFEEGTVKPIIDRVYTLDQIAQAHAYVGKGHKVGGVAIKIC